MIRSSILLIEARNCVTEICAIKLRLCGDLAGEEPFTKRAEWNESDPEFLKCGKNLLFRLPPKKRVLALQGGHGLHSVRSTNCLSACFRQTKVLHLALLNQVLYRPGNVFDRHIQIDTMLIEEVDYID